MDLACACDIRLCSEDANLCIAEVNLGLAADVGTLQRMPKVTFCDSLRASASFLFTPRQKLGTPFELTEDGVYDRGSMTATEVHIYESPISPSQV